MRVGAVGDRGEVTRAGSGSRRLDGNGDDDRARRQSVAEAFLADKGMRAASHPPPTPKTCYVVTDRGGVLFDVSIDQGLAKDVPPEAHRRFRADRRAYQEQVRGPRRLHVHGASRVSSVRSPDPDVDGAGPGAGADGPDIEVDVEVLTTGHHHTITADVVVYATGYRPIDPSGLLGDVGAWCRRAEDGELLVDRDYRLHTVEPLTAGVYLQGPTEHTHGISSTLLSTTAVRAGEILDSVLERASAGSRA